ncbi:sensor histidine kinase [Roseateles chitosanitabidus]|uniref:sensor histidine kinase n=1 Tax=Roseateles chitosanitabidus TaxID=65048 RepID=UPI00083489A0|nr:HAMP domain-containing sensor histidine kinase [Roseateles chitosanitabidus]
MPPEARRPARREARPAAAPTTLRTRIAAAFLLLTLLVCGAFAVAAVNIASSIEDRLIDQRLSRTADSLVELAHQNLPPDLPPSVTLYRGEAIPADLRDKPPGRYTVTQDGTQVNALLRDDLGTRFVLTDSDADFDKIQAGVYGLLGLAFVACLGLALFLAQLTASRIVAPVTALAQAVETGAAPRAYPLLDSTDELGVLSRAFAASTEAQQRYLDRERWFTGDVSHELRTPLAVMLGAAEILKARLSGRDDLVELAERIRRTAADTSERVVAMLLLSRDPASTGAPPTALLPLLRQEMDRCRPLLRGKAVEMTLHAEPDATTLEVPARPELAAIAVGNLIRNACQFTEQGRVDVRLECGRVVIEDTGIGIPSAVRDRIFDRFMQVDPAGAGSAGLGLAIVKRVAEHLGWVVSLEAPAQGGTRFVLSFAPTPDASPTTPA